MISYPRSDFFRACLTEGLFGPYEQADVFALFDLISSPLVRQLQIISVCGMVV